MSTVIIREITEHLNHLSPEKLMIVYDLVTHLSTDEDNDVTHENIVIPLNEYQRLKKLEERQAFLDFSTNFGQELEALGIDESGFEDDLEQTKREVFEERYGVQN